MLSYDPVGTECRSAQAGTQALQAYLIEHFGVTNLGTFNCRPVRGTTTLSLHAEGRAGDNGGSYLAMGKVADLLVKHADALGVQEVIFDREIWRNYYDPPVWHKYTGSDPHAGHVHWALNWASATTLNNSLIYSTLEDSMPLSDTDLDKIAAIVDAKIRLHMGNTGSDAQGAKRPNTVVSACKQAIEASIKAEFREAM